MSERDEYLASIALPALIFTSCSQRRKERGEGRVVSLVSGNRGLVQARKGQEELRELSELGARAIEGRQQEENRGL